MSKDSQKTIPALKYSVLTPLYDLLLRTTMPETRFKTALVEEAKLTMTDRVLDLGCGTGTLTFMIKNHVPSAQVTGLDADNQVLEISKNKEKQQGTSPEWVRGISTDLPFLPNRFEHVLSSLMFHHLGEEEKIQTMKELFRVLVPLGGLHIADWGKPANFLMSLAFYPVQFLDGFSNTNDNRRGLLPSMMENVGFENVTISRSFQTIYGTLTLYHARKPGH